jgi:hypothetical protein
MFYTSCNSRVLFQELLYVYEPQKTYNYFHLNMSHNMHSAVGLSLSLKILKFSRKK